MKKISVALVVILMLITVGCGEEAVKPSRTEDGSFVFDQTNYPKLAVTEYTKTAAVNITAAVLGLDAESARELITVCDTTEECYLKLNNNECDIVLAHEVSAADATLIQSTALWQDALVFYTNGRSKVENLTLEQLQKLYKGEIKDWSEFGTLGDLKMPVVLFGEKDGTAAKAAFEKYIGNGIVIPPVKRPIATEKGQHEATVDYDNRDGAVMYSLLSDKGNLNGNSIKLLKVDGVEATADNYALRIPVTVTIRSAEVELSPVRFLYNWIISEQGKLSY